MYWFWPHVPLSITLACTSPAQEEDFPATVPPNDQGNENLDLLKITTNMGDLVYFVGLYRGVRKLGSRQQLQTPPTINNDLDRNSAKRLGPHLPSSPSSNQGGTRNHAIRDQV